MNKRQRVKEDRTTVYSRHVEVFPSSPVYISLKEKSIKIQHMGDVLSLCNQEEAFALQAALQRTINTHLEWRKDYLLMQKQEEEV